jgi:hypothetical protein
VALVTVTISGVVLAFLLGVGITLSYLAYETAQTRHNLASSTRLHEAHRRPEK